MTAEVQEGPLELVPSIQVEARPKKSGRERRYERRRRRIWFEELLGWILVPVILISGYLLVEAILNALGTSPSAIFNGLGTISSNF
jgi:hypothetical protein